MITYKELMEKMIPDFTIKVDAKIGRKVMDLLRDEKIKFKDESSNFYVFKKESQWEDAMNVLDDNDIDYDI